MHGTCHCNVFYSLTPNDDCTYPASGYCSSVGCRFTGASSDSFDTVNETS